MTVVLFLFNKKKYDFNFLLRCIKQISRFFSELRFCGVLLEWTLQCFLKQWERYDNFLPLAIRPTRILSLKIEKKRAIISFVFVKALS